MWIKGIRRRNCDASQFITALRREYTATHLAKLAGVCDRTIRRWASGEDWCDTEALIRLVDKLLPDVGRGPIYSPDMAIDGDTRLGGVGEFSIQSAKGESYHD